MHEEKHLIDYKFRVFRIFSCRPANFLLGSNRVKFVRTSACRTLTNFLSADKNLHMWASVRWILTSLWQDRALSGNIWQCWISFCLVGPCWLVCGGSRQFVACTLVNKCRFLCRLTKSWLVYLSISKWQSHVIRTKHLIPDHLRRNILTEHQILPKKIT